MLLLLSSKLNAPKHRHDRIANRVGSDQYQCRDIQPEKEEKHKERRCLETIHFTQFIDILAECIQGENDCLEQSELNFQLFFPLNKAAHHQAILESQKQHNTIA